MGRRRNGEGSIYTDQDGATWVQLSAKGGQPRIRRKVPPGVDPVELKRHLEAERDAGRDHARKAETVAQLVEDHLDTIADQISGSTQASKRYRAAHIARHIGGLKLDQVTPETVQKLANTLAREGLGAAYVRQILQLLHAAYEIAVPARVRDNPVAWKKLRLRTPRNPDRRPPADDQVRALLDAANDLEARGADARYGLAWWLAALLGLRRGEIAGLTWRDVNWDRAELHIRQALAPDGQGGYAIGPTKNRQARVLPLGPRLLARLRAQWEAQQAERRYYGPRWQEHGFIIAEEGGQGLANPTRLNHLLSRLCREAQLLECNPHLLRHGAATFLAEEGYGEALIASILGHDSGGSVTRRYIHPSERVRRDAIQAIETRIFGAAAAAAQGAV